MKKLFLILIPMLLFMVVPAFAESDWCYQESVNVTNQTGLDGNCGLSYTGGQWNISGNFSWFQYVYVYNGDWSDGGRAKDASQMAYMWFNYTKPANATSNSMIKYKGSGIFTNFTIPITCWNAYPNKLVFRLNSTYPDWNRLECVQNASIGSPNSTVIMANGTTGHTIYEEAMWWEINLANVTPNTPPYLVSSNLTFFENSCDVNLLVTWNDTEGDAINNTFTEGNFSGSFQNYTGSQEGYINRLDLTLASGFYVYRSYASDQYGLQGVSDWQQVNYTCEGNVPFETDFELPLTLLIMMSGVVIALWLLGRSDSLLRFPCFFIGLLILLWWVQTLQIPPEASQISMVYYLLIAMYAIIGFWRILW